jgi:hypothetical protein
MQGKSEILKLSHNKLYHIRFLHFLSNLFLCCAFAARLYSEFRLFHHVSREQGRVTIDD